MECRLSRWHPSYRWQISGSLCISPYSRYWFSANLSKKGSHLGSRLLLIEFSEESIGMRFHSSLFITKDHGTKWSASYLFFSNGLSVKTSQTGRISRPPPTACERYSVCASFHPRVPVCIPVPAPLDYSSAAISPFHTVSTPRTDTVLSCIISIHGGLKYTYFFGLLPVPRV